MPRRMPALDILPFEKSSERLRIGRGNSGTCELDFFLSEDPGKVNSREVNKGLGKRTNWL